MSRVSAWFVAMVLLLAAAVAALISRETVLALACLGIALCMAAMGAFERKKNRR